MLRNEQDRLIDNGEIDQRQELLDMELKYGRVCIIYHNNAINNDKWYKKFTIM